MDKSLWIAMCGQELQSRRPDVDARIIELVAGGLWLEYALEEPAAVAKREAGRWMNPKQDSGFGRLDELPN